MANPLVKRIRKLRDHQERRRQRAFFIEGVQPVWRAHDAGADIETLVVAPDLLVGSPATALIEALRHGGGAMVELSVDVFASISDRDGPSGVAAIVRMPSATIDTVVVEPTSVVVGLHDIANPGNLGTIIRTADSFGVAGVVLIGATSDPFSPAAVKASMGSLFAQPVVHADSVDAAFEWSRGAGLAVVTSSARAATPLPTATLPQPSFVLFGSEGAGLPQAIVDRGDIDVRIPMRGTASSLNLAVAAGIVLYVATA